VRATQHSVQPILYNNFAVAWKRSLTVEGHLYDTTAANIITKMNALEAALTLPNLAGGIMYSGGVTPHWLPTTNSIGGIQVENFQWLDTPLHMVCEAKFSVTLSAQYANTSEAQDVVSVEEQLEIIGEGGAITPLATQVGALSTRQTTADYSDVVVTQSGVVTGRTTYPALPGYVIATAGARQVTQTRDVRMPVQVRKNLLLFKRQYSFTYTLPSHPGTIVPNVLV
jgi:hypothetical protein